MQYISHVLIDVKKKEKCNATLQNVIGKSLAIYLGISNSSPPEALQLQNEVGKPIDKYSACVEVGKPIDENPACVEARHTSICCKIDGKQYYCSLRKVNSFESLCDLIISDKLFETLNKETATHIGIREAEDWFRPIDLAKECDIYISSRSGSRKEIPITYGYTQYPFKNRSQNFKPKIKENYPQYLERENNCFICGDSSHYARDCEKRFKPKESNDHIHNKINVNTLKIESEKQNSDECTNLQYVSIFVENQPVTALIDSGCQIPVLNSSLIRVQTPSEEIITLSSCFGEQRMVKLNP
ncbi:retrovirus-related Pol polyprotein from transposon 412 [Trichonephila clavipes]|uniref:Retrovirus-related Pol polyprotein from transposon 412 n=1 Tax=Trichonephila clavipes TaxID=2585209 RepID=A0A8X6W341_TRICX|nr:retrovirus-related Pol polyprotein from transposon 412 [Trichonephila clavipes]